MMNFLIVTHSHAIELAEERWEEVRDAFERQAPRTPGDEKYDIRAMLQRSMTPNVQRRRVVLLNLRLVESSKL